MAFRVLFSGGAAKKKQSVASDKMLQTSVNARLVIGEWNAKK